MGDRSNFIFNKVKIRPGLIFRSSLYLFLTVSVGGVVYWKLVLKADSEGSSVLLGAIGASMILVGVVFTGFLIRPNFYEQSKRIELLEEMRGASFCK